MNRNRRSTAFAGLILAASFACGCGSQSRVELTSYKDPYFPETYHFKPDVCTYRHDGGGDCHVVASANRDDGDGAAAQQLLHVHIFWKPRPGKTRDNPTSMDAIVRYVIKTARGTTLYTGTGFAYPDEHRTGDGLDVSIESGSLKVAAQTGNEAEMLGETRLKGKLVARADSNAALDLMRQIDLAAGDEE